MRRNSNLWHFMLLSLLVIFSLVLTACPAAVDTSPAPAGGEAEADTESADSDGDAASGSADKAPGNTESVDTSTVGSQAEQSLGVSVTTDEDVTVARDTSKAGGESRGASSSDAVSFHPYTTTDTASSGYYGNIYDGGLLRLDENTMEYIPHMAEGYTIADDGLTFTFTLRDTLMWSDGTPMTADDWKWTYDQAINPDNAWPYVGQLEFITSYEAIDDRTLEIKIDEIYAPALGQMAGLITPLPKHIWEELPWDDPENNPEINAPSVSSGSHMLKEWKRDQYVIFEANPNWWYKGAPLITQDITEIVPDQDIVYEMFKTGDTDVHGIRPDDLEEAKQLEDVTIYSYFPAAAVWSYVGLNTREGYATGDVHVRRGISYAIDKQLITDEIMQGEGVRQCGPYPDTSWVHNGEVNCYTFDVDKALEEFEMAGYSYDGETMMTPDGEPLTLQLLYGPNTSTIRELIAVTVQDMLSEIGIEVEVQGLEWASFLEAKNAEEPEWDMTIGGWRSTIEPHIMYTIWAEESIPSLNSGAYINKDVEALFAEGGATYDRAVRLEKYAEAQQLIVDDAPYVFLYYSRSNIGVNNRIQGIDPRPIGIGWNSSDWWVEETPE